MTVSSSKNLKVYAGNGVTTTFAYDFRILKAEDLVVRLIDTDTGAIETLGYGTDYAVTGVGLQAGGDVALVDPPEVGYNLVLRRSFTDFLQGLDLRNQGDFFIELIEDTFDRLVMYTQQLRTDAGFALKLLEDSSHFDATEKRIVRVAPAVEDTDVPQYGQIAVAASAAAAAADAAVAAATAASSDADDAETAAAAAQAAAAGVNLPSVTVSDAGKALTVKGDGSGIEAGKIPLDQAEVDARIVAFLLKAGTTVNLSVETSPAGATQFADIQAAISYARRTYIPAGGVLNITVNKTMLSASDSVVPLQTDDLSWINLVFVSGSSYTIPGLLVDCDSGGISPVIKNTGFCTITTSGTRILRASDFGRIRMDLTSTFALNGGYMEVANGGVIQSHTGTLSMENDGRCVQMLGGQIIMESSFSAESTTTDVALSASGSGTRFMAGAAVTLTSAGTTAAQVNDGAEAVLRDLIASSSGTNVSGGTGCFINLEGSAATCNLTDNTITTNGILIR